jgi:hypothetical protein
MDSISCPLPTNMDSISSSPRPGPAPRRRRPFVPPLQLPVECCPDVPGLRRPLVPSLKLPIVDLASPSSPPIYRSCGLGAESSAGEDLVKKKQGVAPRLVVAPWINEIDLHSGGRGRGAAARSGSGFLSSLSW